MSMTENEAIEHAREYIKYLNHSGWEKDFDAIEKLIVATEEIQQYRAIGTVEELVKTQIREKVLNVELESYKEIGTIDEFKALKECVYVDERPFCFVCPNCKEVYTLEQDERPSCCRKCNEKIDWNKVVFYQL